MSVPKINTKTRNKKSDGFQIPGSRTADTWTTDTRSTCTSQLIPGQLIPRATHFTDYENIKYERKTILQKEKPKKKKKL